MQKETEKKMSWKGMTFISIVMALLYFFPILSLVTIIPPIAITEIFSDCESGMYTTCIICAAIAILIIILSLKHRKTLYESPIIVGVSEFILASNINYIAATIILGEEAFCHGDAQSILVVTFSGPIAAVSIILFLIAVIICFKSKSQPHQDHDGREP